MTRECRDIEPRYSVRGEVAPGEWVHRGYFAEKSSAIADARLYCEVYLSTVVVDELTAQELERFALIRSAI